MEQIALYLEKFTKLQSPESVVRREVIAVVKDIVGIEMDTSAVSVRNGNQITLSVHPVVKSELLIHKEELLKCLTQKLQKKGVTVQ